LLVLIALVVLPALGLVLYGNFEQRRIEKNGVRREAVVLSRLAAASQQDYLKNTRQLLTTLTQFPFLLLSTNRDFSEVHLFNLRNLSPDYSNFGLVEADGKLFCSSQRTNAGTYLGDRAYFKRAVQTRNFAVGDFQFGRITGEASLNFGLPVMDEHGEFKRVLYAALKLPRLSAALSNIGLPPGGSVTVLDRTGTVIARQPNPEKWVGKSVAKSPVVERILAQKERVLEMPGLEGVPGLHAVTPITEGVGPALFASVEIPLSVSFAHANGMLWRNFVVLGVVALVVWIVAQFYAQRFFLRPVRALAGAAERLADGDLDTRAGAIHGAAELVEFGRVFDHMASRLQKRQREVQAAHEEIQALNQDLERRVKERTSQLESANKELEAFSYSVSHDLRAPLRHILGFADVLKRDAAPALKEHGQYVDFIEVSARQMGQLIEDLLGFSRTARIEPRFMQFDLGLVVEEVRKNLESQSNERVVEWKVSELPAVRADLSLMRIVFTNLLSNALKYSRTRNPARIEVGYETKPNEHVIFVKDNGVGFDMNYADKLFGIFQRLHDAGEFEGTGVGLAIVQRIIARHGGRVWAEAELDRGATFYFSLPRSQ